MRIFRNTAKFHVQIFHKDNITAHNKKNYEAQKKVEYLENLNEYTKNLELVYNNLRSFKHDYINIMASLAIYIDEKKYDELEAFFMVQMCFSFMLTDKDSDMRICKHCQKAFAASRKGNEFCSQK